MVAVNVLKLTTPLLALAMSISAAPTAWKDLGACTEYHGVLMPIKNYLKPSTMFKGTYSNKRHFQAVWKQDKLHLYTGHSETGVSIMGVSWWDGDNDEFPGSKLVQLHDGQYCTLDVSSIPASSSSAVYVQDTVVYSDQRGD